MSNIQSPHFKEQLCRSGLPLAWDAVAAPALKRFGFDVEKICQEETPDKKIQQLSARAPKATGKVF